MTGASEVVARTVAGVAPGATGYRRANCPVCPSRHGTPDHRASLSVARSGFYRCHRCGLRGRLDGYDDDDDRAPARPSSRDEMPRPETFYPLGEEPGWSSVALGPARAYLRGRGVPESLWRTAGIGACVAGRFARRVVVPVREDGAWVGYVGRAWGEARVPYLYPAGMARGQLLYNSAALDVETDAPLFVVEGVFDSLWLWPDAVAVLGKPTSQQIEQLVETRRPVAVLLDADAWQEGRQLARRLRRERGSRDVGNIRLPPCLDPDELDREALRVAGRVATTCEEGETSDDRLEVEVPDTRYDALYGRGEAYEAEQRAYEEERHRRYDEYHRDTPWTSTQFEIQVILRPDEESEAGARARLTIEQARRRSVWRPGACYCARCTQLAQGA